jgi:AraC family transcriptional regulator
MPGSVEIRTLPAQRAAYMRQVGPYGSPNVADLWRRFERWCSEEGLCTPERRFFGVAQDNPNITPAGRTRYDACLEVGDEFQPRGEVGVQFVPGGRYACVPFYGTVAEVPAAWVRLLGRTLPDAGLHPDLAPAVEIYDAGLPVDARSGKFACLLCMPLFSP